MMKHAGAVTSERLWLAQAARSLAVIVVILDTGGCAYRSQTTAMAVDYNEFVAQATNRQTALNVLRASQREPMHFTSFSEVVGTIRSTGNAGLNVAANGAGGSVTRTDSSTIGTSAGGVANGGSVTTTVADLATRGATNVTPSLSLTVATGTDFKIAANATDEFYKGILNPISSSLIVNYLRQGFPADVLSHLVVGRLEFQARIFKPGSTASTLEYIATVDNNPDEPKKIEVFADAIRCRKLDYASSQSRRPPLEVDHLEELGQLSPEQLARVERFTDAAGKPRFRLTFAEKNDFVLAMSEPGEGQCDHTRALLLQGITAWLHGNGIAPPSTAAREYSGRKIIGTNDDEKGDDPRLKISPTKVRLGAEGYFNPWLPANYRGDLVIDITLRSVEGVLYYLGEYVRPTTPPVLLAAPGICSTACLPILRLRPAAEIPVSDRFVTVDYRGRDYAIPLSGANLHPTAGRSSQVIELVQQLLNLNRSSKDLPSTPLVRVYN